MQLICTASYVNLSDNIVVFGSGGSMLYNGPPENWKNPNTDIFQATDAELPEVQSSAEITVQEAEVLPLVDTKPLPEERDEETIKRQEGDLRVWLYYGRPIGIPLMILTIVLVAISAFTSNFPSMFKFVNSQTHCID